jgi:UrcA family protein
MYTETAVINTCSMLGATIVVCMFFAGKVAAEGSTVSVAVRASAQGVDLSKPSRARELYRRLKNAAWIVCTRGNRVDLEPSSDPGACSENALGGANLSARKPLLTQAHLEMHSLRQAAARGIDAPVAPVQMAAK